MSTVELSPKEELEIKIGSSPAHNKHKVILYFSFIVYKDIYFCIINFGIGSIEVAQQSRSTRPMAVSP